MNDEIVLIPVDEAVSGGNVRRTPRPDDGRRVFAKVMSAGEKEFYDSTQAGYQIALKLEVWIWDYDGERRVEYKGEEYEIIRCYRNDKKKRMELSCERVRGRG